MKLRFGFSTALAAGLWVAQACGQQVQPGEDQVRPPVFHGDSKSCIFDDPGGHSRNCFSDTATFLSIPAPSGTKFQGPSQRFRSEHVTFAGSGFDLGSAAYGWTLQQGDYRLVTSYNRGITQNLNLVTRCRRIGDCANYFYMEHDGGVAAEGDEGVEALGLQANEQPGAYAGTVVRTSGRGDTSPELSRVGDQWVTDGGILVNTSHGSGGGQLSGESSVLGGFLAKLGLTERILPVSDVWGTLTAGFDKAPTLANKSLPVIVDVKLGELPGRRNRFVAGVVCLAGPRHFEQAVIVDPPAGKPLPSAAPGHQALMLLVRYPNTEVSAEGHTLLPMLFQGGVCGEYVSADADLRFSGRRTTYPAFGSLTGADLITAKQVGGGLSHYLPQVGSQAWTSSGPDSRFHLFPGAEIVANNGPAQPLAPELEPNQAGWVAGDAVESPHHMTVGQNVLFVVDQQSSPTDQGYGGSAITAILQGKGMAGFHKGIFLYNGESRSSYRAYGGPLVPPNATYLEGQFQDMQHVVHAPNGALVSVTFCNAAGGFPLFDLPGLKTDHKVRIGYSCDTGALTIPRLTAADVEVTGSLRRGKAEVCTEDGAHCPRPLLHTTLPVPPVAAGRCVSVETAMPGLTPMMTIAASAQTFAGQVTTSTYLAGVGRAGLVVCAPAAESRAAVFNLSAQ